MTTAVKDLAYSQMQKVSQKIIKTQESIGFNEYFVIGILFTLTVLLISKMEKKILTSQKNFLKSEF